MVSALAIIMSRQRRARSADRNIRTLGLVAGGAVLLAETALLVAAAAPLMPSSAAYFPMNASIKQYQAAVGGATVGSVCTQGIQPNDNIPYGVHDFAVYDTALPNAYFTTWSAVVGPAPLYGSLFGVFCPSVPSAAIAHHFGISYIVAGSGTPRPTGAKLVKRIGDEDLYHVRHSAAANAIALSTNGHHRPGATAVPVRVTYPDPTTWRMVLDSTKAHALQLHLTDVPGWHATIDGRSAPLEPWGGFMLRMHVPAGHHVVVLSYWPSAFTHGIV